MSTLTVPTTPTARRTTSTAARVVPYAAAAALLTGPVLWALGMFTSPPQDSSSSADYIASLARDPFITQLSALFLHYGNLLIGLGVLAAPALVRGRRGAWPTSVGALLTAIGFTNVSGMVLSDWWNASVGTHLPSDQAVEVFEWVRATSLFPLWDGTEMFSLVGAILVFAGLARAGVLRWWALALFVGGVASLFVLGVVAMKLAALGVLVGFSPFALIGVRVLQRTRVA
jgi:hypothetical protein